MICPFCKEEIKDGALKCKHCGSMLADASQTTGAVSKSGKNKIAAGLFAILLGGLGVHKFYLGRTGWGIIYLIFCWTFIPALAGIIEGILYLTASDEEFERKYTWRK
ncbi:MAG: NINE protein [Thermodesulfovibrionales bacterium]|jgi:TM2 domain-containing membrane protein YozV